MNIPWSKVVTVVIYVILIGFLIFALLMEKRDIQCADPTGKNKKCGPGMGVAYAAGKPHEGDDYQTLLKKARITSRYEANSIIWRRCYIIATTGAFLVLYATNQKFPSGLKIATAFLIIYIISYLVLTAFQSMITDKALNQMDDIIKLLKTRKC